MAEIKSFVHHVFFWLKEPENAEHKQQLIDGLRKITGIETIRDFQIGTAAGTDRGVIDSSYDVSWLLLFDNKADQDSYQDDPVHHQFIHDCSHLWSKVVVYDTETV